MPQDASRKLLFSHPRMVEDLLGGFAAKPWSDILDFATLENRSAAFVSDGLRQCYGDSLWRLRCGETWLYVLLEFQSTVDRSMAVRLLTYTGLLYQDLFRRAEVSPDGKLPPVLPVVFYNGRRARWTAPLDVTDTLSSVAEALARYQPSLRYFLLDVGRYGADDLPRGNLVSALILLENSRTPGELERALDRLVAWVRGPGERELKRTFGGGFGRCCCGGNSRGRSWSVWRSWRRRGRCWKNRCRSGRGSGSRKAVRKAANKVGLKNGRCCVA